LYDFFRFFRFFQKNSWQNFRGTLQRQVRSKEGTPRDGSERQRQQQQQQQQQPPGVLIEAVSVVEVVGVVRVVIEQGAELRGAELITLLVRGTLAS